MNTLIGKQVEIKNRDSWCCGDWGTVKDFDGEYYHIAIFNDDRTILVFARNEFKVRRGI